MICASTKQPRGNMTDSIYQRLLKEGEKHKGTDLGGLLQVAAHHIESQSELITELEADNKGLLIDCKKMHEGLIKIDAMATELGGLSFGAMPINNYQTVSKDHAMQANIMNYHGVEGYGKKGKPSMHIDLHGKARV
jgi:hypothetical protein